MCQRRAAPGRFHVNRLNKQPIPRGSPITGVRVLLGQTKYESETGVSKQPDNGFPFFWGTGNTFCQEVHVFFQIATIFHNWNQRRCSLVIRYTAQSNAIDEYYLCEGFSCPVCDFFFRELIDLYFQFSGKITSTQGPLVSPLLLSVILPSWQWTGCSNLFLLTIWKLL